MSQLRGCHKAGVFGLVHRRAINLGSARRGVSSMPVQVEPTRAEIARGALDARNLEKAVRALHLDGLVVVKDVVPHRALDLLNEKMVQDALVLQGRGEDGPFNYNQGNLQLDPPPIAKYFIPSVFTNPIATQITSGILGPRPQWTFCSANAAMPAAPGAPSPERQPVHSDADFAHPAHPFALVVNVPLTKMAPANGSTELWLGTHQGGAADADSGVGQQLGAHGERASGRINPRHLAARIAGGRPPVQPVVDKGSVVIRDLRLWHAGMPHRGTGAEARARVMLAMIHFAPWYRGRMRLQFGSSIAGILEEEESAGRLGLEVPVDWVSDEEALQAYMNRGFGNSYDFDQDD